MLCIVVFHTELNVKKQLICDWGHYFPPFFLLFLFTSFSSELSSLIRIHGDQALANNVKSTKSRTNHLQIKSSNAQQTANGQMIEEERESKKRTVLVFFHFVLGFSLFECNHLYVYILRLRFLNWWSATTVSKSASVQLFDKSQAHDSKHQRTLIHYDYILLSFLPSNGTIVKCFEHLYRTHNLSTRRMEESSSNATYNQKQTHSSTANDMEYVICD